MEATSNGMEAERDWGALGGVAYLQSSRRLTAIILIIICKFICIIIIIIAVSGPGSVLVCVGSCPRVVAISNKT